MTIRTLTSLLTVSAATVVVALAQTPRQPPTPHGQPPPPGNQTPVSQQPSQVEIVIRGDADTQPRLAVPDFLALSPDAETRELAKIIAEVLWNDFDYEREFYLIARDTYRSIPQAVSIADPPFDRWRELGADAVVLGAVQKTGNQVRVEVRLHDVRSRQQALAREYTGSAANPRLFAHSIADEIHKSQRDLRGVARTKLTFVSDRDREKVAGTVEKRDVKEVYMADYDGFNQRRITVGRQLNNSPTWSPDARALAYTSWRTGFMDIYISRIYEGIQPLNPAKGTPNAQNYLPMFSPDGKMLAFTSTRDGNPEIYIINTDGTGLRRLTNHPSIDVTPTWSPSGTQIAFTSERSGAPSIYVVGVDGLGLRRMTYEHSDRATWSPAPFNEIAYAARTGPGYDIKVLTLATGEPRQITFGEGSNESPAWSPSGRHLAFSSTRAGRTQIFTVARDGRNVRQITRDGNNQQPHWSH